MTKIEVREINNDENYLWDQLVFNSPHGSVFHLSEWVKTSALLSKRDPIIIGYFNNEELIGGCSLYILTILRFFHYINSTTPLTPYGGFILSAIDSTKKRENESRNKKIISELLKEVTKYSPYKIKIINNPFFKDIRPFTWNNWRCHVNYTYMLPLNNDLFSNISKKVRNTIRKAEKNNIKISKSYEPELYWNLNVDTYSKQNRKVPFTKDYLLGMLDMVMKNNLGEMWIAQTPEGEIASAEIITWDTHMAHRWSAASNYTHKETGATSLLLYEICQNLLIRKFNCINLMAGNTPHLSTFISSFNPKLIPYYTVESRFFGLDYINKLHNIKKIMNEKY